jgi:hypothetical protein
MLIETLSSEGTWTSTRAPLPTPKDTYSSPDTGVFSDEDGTCAAIGTYHDNVGVHLLFETFVNGSWILTTGAMPDSAEVMQSEVHEVSCGDAVTCAAVGMYTSGTGAQGFIETMAPASTRPVTTPSSTLPSSTPPVTTLLGGPTYAKVPVLGHWSGYLVTGSLFTKVTGGVIVPSLTCPRRSANDADQVAWIWAGIGGVATEGNALVQDGVRGSCTSGTQKWSAVLESNPHVYTTVQTLPVAINSRDSVSFTVTVVGSQATYTVSDLTSGQSASVTQRVPTVVPEHSGECVVEPPLEPTGAVSPLPDFGTVTISGCSVTTSLGAVCPVPLGTGCPDGTTYTRVEMATSNNASTVLAKVPVPPRGAKTFQVLWDAYCNPSPECMLG